MNKYRILIVIGVAALVAARLISPSVVHAQDEDSEGIHDQLRTMTKILEASIGNDSIDRRLARSSIFESRIRTEYIPTVGAIFTIPITFPLHPSEDEKGNGAEEIVKEDLWEHFSSARENTSRVRANALPPIEPLNTVDIEINVEREGLDERPVRLFREAEKRKAQTFGRAFQDMRIYMVDGGFNYSIGNNKSYDPVKVSTLTRLIIETIAQYGHRLKSLQNSERILVVLEAPGPRGPTLARFLHDNQDVQFLIPKPIPRPGVGEVVRGEIEIIEGERGKGRERYSKLDENLQERAFKLLLDKRQERDKYDFRMSPFSRQRERDHRLLAFKKSDLQQERSYDSIKGKVETTDY